MSYRSPLSQEPSPLPYGGSASPYGSKSPQQMYTYSPPDVRDSKGKSPMVESPSLIKSPGPLNASGWFSDSPSPDQFQWVTPQFVSPVAPIQPTGFSSGSPAGINQWMTQSSGSPSPLSPMGSFTPGNSFTPSPLSPRSPGYHSGSPFSPQSPRFPQSPISKDITTSMILNAAAASEADVYTPITYAEMVEVQRKEEEVLVKKGGVCPVEDISKHLAVLNTDILTDYIRNNFDNPNVMKSMRCIMEGIYFHAFDRDGKVKNAAAVSNWFTSTKQIGSPSSYGVASIVSIRNAKGAAVVKFSNDPSDDELVHELFVGMYGANEVRAVIPNFAYIYGGFKCSPGFVDSSGEVVGMCSSDKKDVQYVIYEAITPSKEFFDISATISAEQYFSNLIQVCLATHIASEMVGWTHYDLHMGNVMLREVPKYGGNPFYIEYPLGDQVYYVKSNYVATLIDYGMSRIEYNGKSYGFSMTDHEIYPHRAHPLFDVYKYLLSTARYMVETPNVDAVNVARAFYRYFNTTETLKDAVIAQTDVYFVLPYELAEERKLSIPGLLAHVASELPSLFSQVVQIAPAVTPSPVLGCNELGHCATSSQVYSDLNIDHANKIAPKTVMDFYDLSTMMTEEETMELILNFTQYYNDAMDKHIEQLSELCREANNTMKDVITKSRNINKPKLATKGNADVFSDSYLKEVKDYFTLIAKSNFNLKRAEIYFTIGRHVASMFASEDIIIRLDKIKAYIDTSKNVLDIKRNSAAGVLTEINKRLRTVDGKKYLRKNESLYWYITSAAYYL